jgi:hypothetical protein
LAASHVPRITPWRSIAIAAYSEHDGRNRQEPVKYGEIRILYPRNNHSATRTANGGSTARQAAGDKVSVIGFKRVQAGVEQIALRDDDHVEPWRDFVTTKNLSNQSFSSISPDGVAKLAGRGDAEPADAELVGEQKHRGVAAMDLDAAAVHLLKLCTAADPLGWSELQLFAADGQTLAALRTAPFQNQTPVFGAHADQKAVRPLAVARIRLKRANSLSHDIPSH